LNLDIVKSLPVPIPPPAEAAEILRRVSDALAAVADTQALLDAEAANAARLRQSILKAAFEGRLSVQDPADEIRQRAARAAADRRDVAAASAGASARAKAGDSRARMNLNLSLISTNDIISMCISWRRSCTCLKVGPTASPFAFQKSWSSNWESWRATKSNSLRAADKTIEVEKIDRRKQFLAELAEIPIGRCPKATSSSRDEAMNGDRSSLRH